MVDSNLNLETWGGLECTINRVGDSYLDQMEYSGHYDRPADLHSFAELGISKIRYPVLWEKHQPFKHSNIDWRPTSNQLNELLNRDIEPIAGLVHHGSGPAYVNFFDESFTRGLAAYASSVAERFPFLKYYTPVNEPLTTARFCGLYGLWYPHCTDDVSFLKILMSECKGTVLAMQAIRKVNKEAKFIYTEDLGKTHSTSLLKYQADFENHRRWLGSDLLCGRVDSYHPLYKYLKKYGVTDNELQFFINNSCPPDILGLNYYVTSERYLDHRTARFPSNNIGSNNKHRYADVEVVRVGNVEATGAAGLLKGAWERYRLPLAITEAHLHCSREDQLRWLSALWITAKKLRTEGVDIRAVTFWALLGSFGWNKLLVKPKGDYESGIYDIRSSSPRPTVLSKLVRAFSKGEDYKHPVLYDKGWWEMDNRVLYNKQTSLKSVQSIYRSRPLMIIGKTGTLGFAFGQTCIQRNIHHHLLDRQVADITSAEQIEFIIRQYKPWAVINAAGYVRVEDAESDPESCYKSNTAGPAIIAELCLKYAVKLVIFSSDLVFDGSREGRYLEKDPVNPLNVYGASKARAEYAVLRINPDALIIRTSAFFGPWDDYNFVAGVLKALKEGREFNAEIDVLVSPTYVPDLAENTLNLLLDDESGIWHLSNDGATSWANLALEVAQRAKLNHKLIRAVSLNEMNYKARRPKNSALESGKGILLPSLENAFDRYFNSKVYSGK
ncbi:family 1 glycosylhydrolase [Daejeonella sp.]|uniref:family 1 glycosylhydrolase n=1 Tax=Daejeonella sp. TaxID=2805397 RepID=UPI0039836D87